MIPLRLYVRNFMCYREQALDFSGIHLACLTGSNGHGKSALLDALTWALWGRSRVGARRDDELIYLGQTDMEVEFEFQLAGLDGDPAQAVRYRAIRKRSKRKQGQSSLELQGWDPAEGRYRPLSEPTMAGTQVQINDLLCMDYDTFINSAFLLQGRADEFTVKRPGERKQVLADILGLQVYDRYEKLAKDTAQARKARADQVRATIEQIDQELTREPEYQAAVQTAEAVLARVRSERARVEQDYSQARTALQEAESAHRQLVEIRRRMEATQTEADRLQRELAGHRERLAEMEAALSGETEIERGYAAYQQAAAQNEALNSKLTELVSLQKQRSEYESQVVAARHELDKERHLAVDQAQQLEKATLMLEQESQWQAVQAELARLEARASERETLQQDMQALMAASGALEAENRRAKEDADQIKDKIGLLSATRTGEAHEHAVGALRPEEGAPARCPLCNQPLTEAECARLVHALESELADKREAYRQRAVQIQEHKQRIEMVRATMSEIDHELRARSGLQRQEAALGHAVQQARQAQESLVQVRAALQEVETRLQQGDYAPTEREALRQVELHLAELGYDADAHRRIQADIEVARPWEARMQTLREARSSVETVRLAIAQLCRSHEEMDSRLAVDRAEADRLEQVARQLPDRQRQALEARQALDSAHDREQQANLQLGAARNKLDYCGDLRKQRDSRTQEEQHLRQEQAAYEELQRAFGKNGVQAMLIEGSIPDIEREANHLLARMTHGKMHVVLDTQRDSKKGTAAAVHTIETLDIWITDELGTRSYETYSGGERYRINFAIRIALSKLLTRRAGAQLQMLVIDEGFGTQDTEGLDGLIQAIHSVQDDFACILAITHIEELKDAFNVRIEVTKTPNGSEITVT